jgi:hypothetical protein
MPAGVADHPARHRQKVKHGWEREAGEKASARGTRAAPQAVEPAAASQAAGGAGGHVRSGGLHRTARRGLRTGWVAPRRALDAALGVDKNGRYRSPCRADLAGGSRRPGTDPYFSTKPTGRRTSLVATPTTHVGAPREGTSSGAQGCSRQEAKVHHRTPAVSIELPPARVSPAAPAPAAVVTAVAQPRGARADDSDAAMAPHDDPPASSLLMATAAADTSALAARGPAADVLRSGAGSVPAPSREYPRVYTTTGDMATYTSSGALRTQSSCT